MSIASWLAHYTMWIAQLMHKECFKIKCSELASKHGKGIMVAMESLNFLVNCVVCSLWHTQTLACWLFREQYIGFSTLDCLWSWVGPSWVAIASSGGLRVQLPRSEWARRHVTALATSNRVVDAHSSCIVPSVEIETLSYGGHLHSIIDRTDASLRH